MARKPKKSASSVVSVPSVAEKDQSPAPIERSIRQAAFACENFESAAEQLGVPDLQGLLDGSKKLAAAWERGRFLRSARQVALKGIVKEEADRFFEPPLARGELVERLKRDRRLADVWTSGAESAKAAAREGMMRLAKEGDGKAMALYERLLVEEKEAGPAVDWQNLTQTQLEKATGIKRMQLHRWEKGNGLPRHAGGGYDLPAFIAWFEQFQRDKVSGGIGTPGRDPLRDERAKDVRQRRLREAGLLMETAKHLDTLRGMAQWLMRLLSDERAREWSKAHEGKTAPQLLDLYLAAFREVRERFSQATSDLPLPKAVKAKFDAAFEAMNKVIDDKE